MADDVRVYATSINAIIKDKEHAKHIYETAHIINILYINATSLLNLYVIDSFNNNPIGLDRLSEPTFLRKVIGICYGGYKIGSFKDEDREVIELLYKLFDDHIKPHCKEEWLLHRPYDKYFANYMATRMLTDLKINIKEHFEQRMKAFVNKMLSTSTSDKTLMNKLRFVKQDLWNRTLLSDTEFHSFIQLHQDHVLPKDIHTNGIYYDIEANPIKYLYSTLYMNQQLEKNTSNVKLFKCIPLRTTMSNHFIPIDFQNLVMLFPAFLKEKFKISQKKLLFATYRELIFDSIFQMDKKEFADKKRNGDVHRKFDYLIQTDGVSCRLYFRTVKSQNRRREGENTRTTASRIETKKSRTASAIKFEYLNKVGVRQRSTFKNKLIVGMDPGKNDIYSACCETDGKKTYFSYSSQQKRVGDYTTRRLQICNKLKKNLGLQEFENQFAENANRKRCSMSQDCFSDYLSHKYKYMRHVEVAYMREIWNKLAWRGFIRKDQTKHQIINDLKNKLSSMRPDINHKNDVVIAIGDWSHNLKVQIKSGAPTIGIGFLRLLRRSFDHVYLIDEYKTSIICNKCHHRCNNPVTTSKIVGYYKDDNPIKRRVHKILRCTNENCRIYWNRDVNGSSNILCHANSILSSKPLPEAFVRG